MSTIYSKVPGKTNGKTYIQASTTEEDELGFRTRKTGFIEVNAEKADAIMEKLESGELGLNFGPQSSNGLYELQVVRTEVAVAQ